MESSNSGSSVRRASESLESNNLVPNSIYDLFIYIYIYMIYTVSSEIKLNKDTVSTHIYMYIHIYIYMYIYIYVYTHYLSCPADDPGAPSWPSGNMSSQLLKDIRTHWLAPNLMQWL